MKAVYRRENGEELEFVEETMIVGETPHYVIRKSTPEEIEEWNRGREKFIKEYERRKHMEQLQRYWADKRRQEEKIWQDIEKPYIERESECNKKYSEQNKKVKQFRKTVTTGGKKCELIDKYIKWLPYGVDSQIKDAYKEFAENASPILEGGE